MIRFDKRKDCDFVVLNLTDPQLLTPEWEKEHIGYRALTYTVTKLVGETKPDLIYEAAFNKDCNPEEISFEDSTRGVCWNDGYKNSFGVNLEEI